MVDRDDDGTLVLSAFMPQDVDSDGMTSGAGVSWYAYLGTPAHPGALDCAAHAQAPGRRVPDTEYVALFGVWTAVVHRLGRRLDRGGVGVHENGRHLIRGLFRVPVGVG
ncbi:hypothetical protein VO63_22005 [Streptomyces showdoensis]|uniref:Uncharacterized protein n=1 Tax=Streptomyces showdoensis TaxID=68268 RepID=A0A2P2GJJ9_STREW|nr:hypothetical protein VO63_22005 [Streptomyces showdoensis]